MRVSSVVTTKLGGVPIKVSMPPMRDAMEIGINSLAGLEAGDKDVPVMIGQVWGGIETIRPVGSGQVHRFEEE
jgi:hypothetical protein